MLPKLLPRVDTLLSPSANWPRDIWWEEIHRYECYRRIFWHFLQISRCEFCLKSGFDLLHFPFPLMYWFYDWMLICGCLLLLFTSPLHIFHLFNSRHAIIKHNYLIFAKVLVWGCLESWVYLVTVSIHVLILWLNFNFGCLLFTSLHIFLEAFFICWTANMQTQFGKFFWSGVD